MHGALAVISPPFVSVINFRANISSPLFFGRAAQSSDISS